MPEGDTLYRTAAVLRPVLSGKEIKAASAPRGGPAMHRVVGSRVSTVESQGKNLLIGFENGLMLRTHLRMWGSWHRYRPGEPWRRPLEQARVVIEVEDAVAVCFNAPVAELFDARALAIHPAMSRLGPDILVEPFDVPAVVQALRERAGELGEIGEVIMDQRVLAGIGNVYKNESLFVTSIHPYTRVADMDDAAVAKVIECARDMMRSNVSRGIRVTDADGPPHRGVRAWIHDRRGLPCRRCLTKVVGDRQGELNRHTMWCPRCQPVPAHYTPRTAGAKREAAGRPWRLGR
ncbi:MAG: DNA-formamidopyrimidine glycosylase family protein [Dehalococcoidia bacterium]